MGQIQGTLEVTIVEGRNLKDGNVIGKNDAYVEVYLNENERQTTTIARNTNDPIWNQKFTFNFQKENDFLYLDVYDKDVVGRDSIGSAKIDVRKHVRRYGRYDEWITLTSVLDQSSTGEIHIILEHFADNRSAPQI